MGCGCKKNKATQTISPVQNTVTNINSTISLTSTQSSTSQNLTLTEQQQREIDNIIDKINKLS